jgi:hypothetical protein
MCTICVPNFTWNFVYNRSRTESVGVWTIGPWPTSKLCVWPDSRWCARRHKQLFWFGQHKALLPAEDKAYITRTEVPVVGVYRHSGRGEVPKSLEMTEASVNIWNKVEEWTFVCVFFSYPSLMEGPLPYLYTKGNVYSEFRCCIRRRDVLSSANRHDGELCCWVAPADFP